jgi:uncharacterized membrane protein HdeD (DUF308 family)
MTAPAEPPSPTQRSDWRPPRERETNVASMVVGIVLLVIGIWYLLEQTLGIRLPRINWGDFWPVILIVIGGIMLYRSATHRT